MSTDVLVVIPTVWPSNRRYQLVKQLEAASEVSHVIMVDNGNNLNLKTLACCSKVQVFRPGYNLNWLKSCNVGARIAIKRQVDFVCWLNDDVYLAPKFFTDLLAAYNSDCGVIGPSYTGDLNPQLKTTRRVPEDMELDYVDGTCMLVPVPVLEKVGLLDEHFRPPGWGADLDFCYRVKQAGKKVIGTKRTKLYHYKKRGGYSAEKIYGSRHNWQRQAVQQMDTDMTAKYGTDWQTLHNFRVTHEEANETVEKGDQAI